ncbi:hypothetical protein Nepgr_014285 [Nepenthes gracilis]|uniref:Complex III subunit VII n=1 Tax=Nepenthes gracilis TaxID=150966 RepID=A0AAD3SKM3_NEPGR|nr:hypothetical protein Nepgr_014285 [Nepenthes gracilis]
MLEVTAQMFIQTVGNLVRANLTWMISDRAGEYRGRGKKYRGESAPAMASSFMKWLVDPRRNFLAAVHKKSMDKRLRKYGIRLDDMYDPMEDLDIKEALNRLPREIVDARNQRLKRAMDLSMKHEYLPEELQAVQTPFRSYLQDMFALVKKERAEREALGALPLYQRTIP